MKTSNPALHIARTSVNPMPGRLAPSEPKASRGGFPATTGFALRSALFFAFIFVTPLLAAAQDTVQPAPRPSVEQLKRNVERWKALPQAERERIKQSYRQFRQFKPEQAATVKENFEKFRNLPPERRRELTKKFEGLSSPQRERIAQKLRQLQQMGGERRRMAVAFARMAHGLTPEQKRQLEQLGTPEEKRKYLGREFRGHVMRQYLADKPTEERQRFESLSPPEQKKLLQHFFRERVMRGPPGERGGAK